MRLRTGLVALVAALGLMSAGAITASAAPSAPAPSAAATLPISGTTATGDAFNGVLTVDRFVSRAGQLAAAGTLSGTITNAVGAVIGSVTNVPVQVPVTGGSGSCPILHLELGPLDLNLLGLMVHLNQVVLDITAQSGPGQLLGNLLCAVAHLLDSNAPLGSLSGLLNHILRLL